MEKLHDDENTVLASLAAADEEAAEKTGKDLPPLTSAPAAKQLPDKPWLEKALEEVTITIQYVICYCRQSKSDPKRRRFKVC